MASVLRHITTPLLLLTQTLYCWYCFYQAQFFEYDENIGLLLHAFLISLATVVVVAILSYFRIRWVELNLWIWLIWVVIGSPITFVVAAIYCSDIFGTILPG